MVMQHFYRKNLNNKGVAAIEKVFLWSLQQIPFKLSLWCFYFSLKTGSDLHFKGKETTTLSVFKVPEQNEVRYNRSTNLYWLE